MNGAMDCYGRAAAALDTPGRAIEYNLASKLALTAAALSKAYDSHRLCAQDLPVLVDDTVKPTGGLGTANSGGEPGDKAPSRSEERAASNDEAKHAKK
jgi:hypothetical protein